MQFAVGLLSATSIGPLGLLEIWPPCRWFSTWSHHQVCLTVRTSTFLFCLLVLYKSLFVRSTHRFLWCALGHLLPELHYPHQPKILLLMPIVAADLWLPIGFVTKLLIVSWSLVVVVPLFVLFGFTIQLLIHFCRGGIPRYPSVTGFWRSI